MFKYVNVLFIKYGTLTRPYICQGKVLQKMYWTEHILFQTCT